MSNVQNIKHSFLAAVLSLIFTIANYHKQYQTKD